MVRVASVQSLLCVIFSDPKPLALRFTDDTPFVAEYSIIASFEVNKEDAEMTCNIPKLGVHEDNCKYVNVV